jgi:hypothetical protein
MINISQANTDNMGKLFVTVFALLLHSRQICNGFYQLRFATLGKARICPQYKSCTVTDSCLRDKLYHDTAPVPATNFVTGD